MKHAQKLTKKEFYALGGLSNPELFRNQKKGQGWIYWQRGK